MSRSCARTRLARCPTADYERAIAQNVARPASRRLPVRARTPLARASAALGQLVGRTVRNKLAGRVRRGCFLMARPRRAPAAALA